MEHLPGRWWPEWGCPNKPWPPHTHPHCHGDKLTGSRANCTATPMHACGNAHILTFRLIFAQLLSITTWCVLLNRCWLGLRGQATANQPGSPSATSAPGTAAWTSASLAGRRVLAGPGPAGGWVEPGSSVALAAFITRKKEAPQPCRRQEAERSEHKCGVLLYCLQPN